MEFKVVILFILIWLLGFFAGCRLCARKALTDIKECQKGLERLRLLHNEYKETSEKYIGKLESENNKLKVQLNYYKLGGNVNNGSSVLE